MYFTIHYHRQSSILHFWQGLITFACCTGGGGGGAKLGVQYTGQWRRFDMAGCSSRSGGRAAKRSLFLTHHVVCGRKRAGCFHMLSHEADACGVSVNSFRCLHATHSSVFVLTAAWASCLLHLPQHSPQVPCALRWLCWGLGCVQKWLMQMHVTVSQARV